MIAQIVSWKWKEPAMRAARAAGGGVPSPRLPSRPRPAR
ncbi:hypothetical protein KS03_2340 [Burkholderia glumae LMG 2196 = ATCC 33617]|nr:hypothetical protein KS03_2340 [Burkholderia glumae LMG 2196 = ATCC 33617]